MDIMCRFSNIFRRVVYRYVLLFLIVLAVVLGKNAGSENTKRITTSTSPPTTTKERTSQASSTTTTSTSTKNNSTYAHVSSTNPTGTSALHSTSTPATATRSTTSTTASTVNQQTRTSPGPGPVVKLSVETLAEQFGSSDIELSGRVMKSFHSCLCNSANTLCTVTPAGVEDSIARTPSLTFVKTYVCFLGQEAEVLCKRITDGELSTVCEKDKACAPDFTTFGPGCPLESVDIFWRKDQKLYVDLWKSEVNSYFICNASCWNADSGSGDDDADTDYDDDSVNPIIIGVVVSLGVVLVIIFLTIIVFMVHSRRKALAGQRYASSAQSLTSSSSQDGHPALDTPLSSIETSDQEPHSNVGYIIHHAETKTGRLENDRSSNEAVRPQDPAYAYIDDGLVSGKNEYATLDEALQYRHVYNRASSQTNDPKLRPPLPLPKHTRREPLPYYSVARTLSESEEPGVDSVSGQYLKLIGENSSSSSQPQSDAKPADVGMTTANNNFAAFAGCDRIKNDYFELERDSGY